MDFAKIFSLIVTAIFIQNIIFAKFLGTCPFMGVSKKVEASIGMGMAVTFVMALASGVTWTIQNYLLVPLQLEYLQTIAFILIIASLVQFVEMAIQKTSPNLYKALGVFLPLITTNCAVLGIAILNIQQQYSFIESVINGAAVALGFTLALVLLAGIRERIEYAAIPEPFKGVPIAFVSAGLLAMAFMGFSGMQI